MKEYLLNSASLFAGFVLSVIGILLPWQIRKAYMLVLGKVSKEILRSRVITGFLTDIAFSSEQAREALIASSKTKGENPK